MEGVSAVSVNLLSGSMQVTYDENTVTAEGIVDADHLLIPPADAVRHAGAEVFPQQLPAEAVEGGVDGGDLDQDVRTIDVLLQHFAQASDLSFDAAEAVAEFFQFRLAAGRQ